MDFVMSGFKEHDIKAMQQVFTEIRAKFPWETEQRLLSMAITRLYLDLMDPPMAENYPSREDLAAMRNGAPERSVTDDDMIHARKELQAFFAAHLSA